MSFTTLSIRHDIARKLKAAKLDGESYSDLLARLLENEPAKTVGQFLASLAPLEGRGVLTEEQSERLKKDQRIPRSSIRKRRTPA